MNRINIQFEADPDADAAALAADLQERIRALPEVQAAQARASQQRILGVGEVVAVIGVGVLLVRGGRELVEEVRLLLPQIAGLLREVKNLRGAYLELKGQRVPLESATPEQVAEAMDG